jgi:exosortase E/protease (VPEID-CTERM system)
LANAARIAALVWVGSSGHAAFALGGLHSKLGWILLVGLALGGIALVERSPWLSRRAPARQSLRDDGGVPPETGAYLGPLVVAMGTALVTGIWAEGSLDRWYGARILATLVVLIAVRRSLPSLRPSGSWLPVLVGAGVAVAWVAGAGGTGGGLAEAAVGMGTGERWIWIVIRVAGSVLVIPIAEELAFRGFLLPWLVDPDIETVPPQGWTWPALLLSSLAFGAIHSSIALGTLAGVAFALARLWRGRLGDAILAHAVANAGVALAVLAGGRWDLWG